jgi:ABC-type hemin transport system substrate-binding protein
VLNLRPATTNDGAMALLADLGRRFRREGAAAQVLARWRTEMAQMLAVITPAEPQPRVLCLHFGLVAQQFVGLRTGTPSDRMLRWAGGVNAIESAGACRASRRRRSRNWLRT